MAFIQNMDRAAAGEFCTKAITAGLCGCAFGLTLSVSIAQIGLALAAAGAAAKLALEQTASGALANKLYAEPAFPAWALYLAIGLLSALTAISPARSLNYLPSDIMKAAAWFTLLALVNPGNLKLISSFYLAGAATAALWGLSELAYVAFTTKQVFRVNGTMNAVTYGEVMLLAFGLAFIKYLRRESGGQKNIYFALSILLAAAVALSQSRGALLAAGIFMVLLALFDKKALSGIFKIAALSAFLLFAISSADPRIGNRIKALPKAFAGAVAAKITGASPGTAAALDMGAQYRLEQWRTGWQIISDFPLLGVGPANVKNIFHFYHPGPIDNEFGWSNVHNLYLQQAAERGLAGLGALLYLFAVFCRVIWKAFKTERNEYTLWAACAFPGFLIMNLTETSFQHAVVAMSVFFMLAAARSTTEQPKLM